MTTSSNLILPTKEHTTPNLKKILIPKSTNKCRVKKEDEIEGKLHITQRK
jgi:hypothetical protein